MKTNLRLGRMLLLVLAAAFPALGQSEPEPDESVTYQGFTGLFNIISPDTLDRGEVSFGVVGRNYDRELTDIDVNDMAAVFGVGLADRLEFGFSYVANRQMDFDDPYSGAFYNAFPVAVPTIESGGGDLWLGLKAALVRMEERGAGLALLGQVKIPTAEEMEGRGTGGVDLTLGMSAGFARRAAALYANAAYTKSGDFDGPGDDDSADVDLADVVTYGAGLELMPRSVFRPVAEISGELFAAEDTAFFVDGVAGEQEEALDLTVGFKVGGTQHGGVSLGAAYVRNLLMDDKRASGEPTNPNGWVVELSFTSYQRPAPPAEVPPTPMNHPPTCSLTATPDTVYPVTSAKTHAATITAQGADPDGDSLSWTWSSSGGSVSGSGASVTWTPAEGTDEGGFTVTAVVRDGKGGEGTCGTTVSVKPDPEYFAGRVQFEFDRYDLSDEARAVIRKAADHLKRFPNLKVSLEGHCCYIATEEYNLQLGQHRAEAVRAHLVSLGVDPGRVSTISYGETRPWQDNAREITRRLNRRGEFRFKFSE